jgi:hypothetical protein
MNQRTNETYSQQDPRHHTQKLRQMLQDTAAHAREDVTKITEPKAQALFETAAEVLLGLSKAFADYEQQNEPAWKAQGAR